VAYALHSITHSRTFRDVTCSTIRVFDRHRSSTVPSRRQGRRTAAMLTEGKTASANVSQTVWEASPRGQQFCHVGRAASRGSTRDPLRILFGPVLDRMACMKPACTTENFGPVMSDVEAWTRWSVVIYGRRTRSHACLDKQRLKLPHSVEKW